MLGSEGNGCHCLAKQCHEDPTNLESVQHFISIGSDATDPGLGGNERLQRVPKWEARKDYIRF